MAVGEYQTRTSVESAAGTPSTGENWEKPVSTAAVAQASSAELPVHLDLGLDPGRPHVQISRPAVIDVRGVDQSGQGERQSRSIGCSGRRGTSAYATMEVGGFEP